MGEGVTEVVQEVVGGGGMGTVATVASSILGVITEVIKIATTEGNSFLLIGVAGGFISVAVGIFRRLSRG